MQAQATSAGIYTQFSGFTEMKTLSKKDPEKALQQVAKQLEGIFLQMMLKSMRKASFGNPLFGNDNSKLYRDMFDKQIALNMSEQKGIGLAESLVRQMHRYIPSTAAEKTPAATASPAQALPLKPLRRQTIAVPAATSSTSFKSPQAFVHQLWPHAQQAAGELGVDPGILIAQAALETGWGKAISHDASGKSSHNLFNIKADARWHGPAVVVKTLEYDGGTARRETARFRAYDSFADSFRDYVKFLKSNQRYQTALGTNSSSEFVKELHAAGYATDPRYADKILNIADRDSFRSQLAQVQSDAPA